MNRIYISSQCQDKTLENRNEPNLEGFQIFRLSVLYLDTGASNSAVDFFMI